MQNDAMMDYQSLKFHYKGVSENARALLKYEDDTQGLFYLGEKKPHKRWE